MGISKEQIIQTSIAILNKSGLENLTMRTLAKELDIKAASLYWHIKNKQDLLDLLAEEICRPITIEDSSGDTEKALFSFSQMYREALLKVRNAVQVLMESTPHTPHRLELIQHGLRLIQAWGVSDANCLAAMNMFNNYVLAFADDEARFSRWGVEETKAAVRHMGMEFRDFDEQFRYGISVLLAGFRAVQ
ncbi:TetR/AcrR family transcriptional regulator C-terminal domain-containing protein [Desulfosporosinus sp. PR]|uniref:TetR/AcrR family transcriptional regulator C-terminal domain-containing protein n=1 Tax=Candidatus Desulfosporosinus nitrosoreducens TaxID=3401928 RepID=UPI0027EAA30E|nr:TetR/AcrR family transcriptional regulator C-terminal domain-containing protein [Desulfosporosinus sp. PR]MDQ7093541.1 TetR/AcrR family transcriptional regulator C-terminal domain-containing protein [Desulfosporosinus sp. PR]